MSISKDEMNLNETMREVATLNLDEAINVEVKDLPKEDTKVSKSLDEANAAECGIQAATLIVQGAIATTQILGQTILSLFNNTKNYDYNGAKDKATTLVNSVSSKISSKMSEIKAGSEEKIPTPNQYSIDEFGGPLLSLSPKQYDDMMAQYSKKFSSK